MFEKKDYLLIVDDNASVRRLLFEIISDEGYKVETAGSGTETIRMVTSSMPSLILLDVKMPGMSGLETLEKLRVHAPGVPVIMMTAYSEMDACQEAKNRGLVREYLKKPFEIDKLRFLIKNIMPEKIA
ncbi:MAG TPA: two-component system response regulator [Desulfotomaculum sp.]|nr:two-component system response regulator [Desulfotomaculum sp.]